MYYVDSLARTFILLSKVMCSNGEAPIPIPRFLPSNIVQLTLALLVSCVTERILMSRNVFRRQWPLRGGGVNLGPNREQFGRPNREIFATDGLFICNLPDIVAKLRLPSPTLIRFVVFSSVSRLFLIRMSQKIPREVCVQCRELSCLLEIVCCNRVLYFSGFHLSCHSRLS